METLNTFKACFKEMKTNNFIGVKNITIGDKKYQLARNLFEGEIYYGILQLSKYPRIAFDLCTDLCRKGKKEEESIDKVLREFNAMVLNAKSVLDDLATLEIDFERLLKDLNEKHLEIIERAKYTLYFYQWNGLTIGLRDRYLLSVAFKDQFDEGSLKLVLDRAKDGLSELTNEWLWCL